METSESASPSPKPSPTSQDRADGSRRHSARQPKQRVDSLPIPLTAAAVTRRRHSTQTPPAVSYPCRGNKSSAKEERATQAIVTQARGRGATEMFHQRGGHAGGVVQKLEAPTKASPRRRPGLRRSKRSRLRPLEAMVVQSAQQQLLRRCIRPQRQYAERSFSDFDYEDDEEEVESALDDADAPPHSSYEHSPLARRTSHSFRRSPIKARDRRSPSASSATSSIWSIASSLGYMYPTVPDTGSHKVSQSLAEIQKSDPEATSSDPIEAPQDTGEGDVARKDFGLCSHDLLP